MTTEKDFVKEFHYNYQLSHHPKILSCYQVKFRASEYYVFAMEYAPHGDLASHVGSSGIPESCCKKICEQLSSALGFMHMKVNSADCNLSFAIQQQFLRIPGTCSSRFEAREHFSLRLRLF
jgi:hypothetical protein